MIRDFPCPCGSGLSFDTCCRPFIDRDALAPTPEALMRSRYSAYQRGEIDYIVATHDPDTRAPALREKAAEWAASARFVRLEVVEVDCEEGQDRGMVHFKADFIEGGEKKSLEERSEFRRRDDRWFYVKGRSNAAETVVRETRKVGRNEPCPCGSGRKFKKCCGRAS